jgi:hypothetical protein
MVIFYNLISRVYFGYSRLLVRMTCTKQKHFQKAFGEIHSKTHDDGNGDDVFFMLDLCRVSSSQMSPS